MLAALEARRFLLERRESLLAELAEVLARPRIVRREHITQAVADAFVSRLRRRAVVVPVTGSVTLCRDPDDNVVIETAAVGQATMLVTRDDDLNGDAELVRVLATGGIEVLSVRRFPAALDDSALGEPQA